jgi:hypothetical protein
LDARLATLLSKNITASKSKEMKTGCSLTESSKKVTAQEGLICQ